MDDALRVVVEMTETIWGQLKNALEDLSEEEIHWRPLPQANTIRESPNLEFHCAQFCAHPFIISHIFIHPETT